MNIWFNFILGAFLLLLSIFSFWIFRLLSFPQSSLKPMQMKSSMSSIYINRCIQINMNTEKYVDGIYDYKLLKLLFVV